jgi:dTDP-4-dehydrorhamnose reductase
VLVAPLDMQLVWITGAGGLVGSYLTRSAPELCPQWQVAGPTRSQLDLLDFPTVARFFTRQKPQLVIHCAALSRSPACQANPQLAWKLNVDVTRHLAELAVDIPFIFFSTDLVFDGRKGNYVESEPPNPLSVYGETKAAAERIVLANPKHTVIRTSLNGGTSPAGDRGFNEEMRCAWAAGKTLNLFSDEFRCPIPAAVTAQAVWELAAQNLTGLYHLAGAERLSRWQIGQLIAVRWPQLNPKTRAGSLREYEGPPRAPDTSLNCGRIQKVLSFELPGLGAWLKANPCEVF